MSNKALWEALDILCPMQLILDSTCHILHIGPTAAKMAKDWPPMIGRQFLELVEFKRPRSINTVEDLKAAAGRKLQFDVLNDLRTPLKGILVPLPGKEGHMVLNSSFGISIIDGVREYALTNADFAATDLAIELLYLVEAKTAAMEASHRLNQRLQVAKIAAEEQAYTDTLTGLKNRRAMDMLLTRMLSAGEPFAVMHIDLDFFKEVNDTFGHAAGDHVLMTVARLMSEETRQHDCVARVGGDEFTVILPNIKDEATLRRVGERIITAIKAPILFKGEVCNISASIGTVWLQAGHEIDKDQLMSNADIALYASKHAGRAQQTFYTPQLREAANAEEPPKGRAKRSGDAA